MFNPKSKILEQNENVNDSNFIVLIVLVCFVEIHLILYIRDFFYDRLEPEIGQNFKNKIIE